MQNELAAEGLPATLQLAGINQSGHEAGNEAICSQRDLPWLQEGANHAVWAAWEVTYRDVIVLDEKNQPLAIYNLTEHPLGNPANYNTLKDLLRQAVEAAAAP